MTGSLSLATMDGFAFQTFNEDWLMIKQVHTWIYVTFILYSYTMPM